MDLSSASHLKGHWMPFKTFFGDLAFEGSPCLDCCRKRVDFSQKISQRYDTSPLHLLKELSEVAVQ